MIVVFDIEDDSAELVAAGKSGFDKAITQIAAISETRQRFFNTGNVKEFLKWLHRVGATSVWAFNTQYDLGDLCHAEKDLKLDDFDLTMVKGRFIKGKTQGLKFCDVRNLCGGSVADLGLAVGLPKLGHPYSKKDYLKFNPRFRKEIIDFLNVNEKEYFSALESIEKGIRVHWPVTKSETFRNSKYVFRDCEIPLRWLLFVKEQCDVLGLENIPSTLGTLCTKAFTETGGENWFEASEDTSGAIRGARVEIFCGGGDGRIAYTDINSLYPWCMTQLFPECIEEMPVKGNAKKGFDLAGYGICDCDVEVNIAEKIAPLPIKDESGRLLFPVGKFSGVWTLAELRNAVACGGTKIKKIRSILGSATGKAYYRDYITDMYQRRLEAKSPAESLFWKLLMNNLYGRLAIGDTISRSMVLTDENKDDPNGLPYGTKILCDCKTPLPAFTNYLHAAHVLSYARMRLFSYLKQIPADDLIYCDTDSIIFFCKDKLPFECNTTLGEMKLEKMGVRAEPFLPKTYTFTDQTHKTEYKAKGVPKKFAQKFIETGKAEYEMPFKLRESIRFYESRNENLPESRKLSVWRKVEKIRAATYDKKRKSGKYLLPLILK